MQDLALQKTLSSLLAIGSSAITIFLIIGSVTDPVNAPKMFLLGGVSGAAIALTILFFIRKSDKPRTLDYVLLLFVLWSMLAVLKSISPLSQNIYGTYGRNTGWLTYLLLAGVAVAASRVRLTRNFERIIIGFVVALGINLIYGIWVLVFGDFLGWNNIYGALLGTFGNPNFISSFLGMSFSAVLALSFSLKKNFKLLAIAVLPVIAFQLVKADSLQGVVVAALGTWLVGFFWIRGKFEAKSISWLYFGAGSICGAVGVLGALGHGPLKHALAQPTVALREQYWLAAWNMVKGHPIFGVGMDSYGDWYRRARSPQALITPGPDTVTNVSHNVFLDLLACGGFPLFLLYLIFVGCGLVAILKVLKRNSKYDSTFVTLTVLWVGFQAQSIISINQIGLAIWGWLLTGLLVGYEIDSRTKGLPQEGSKSSRVKSKSAGEIFSPQLIAFIGGVIGLLIAVPPLSADLKWRSIQITGQASGLSSAFSGSYLSPLNSYTLASAVELLENSKLPDLAIIYARQGVKFNPSNLDAWKMLYYATNSTANEKSKARLEMIRLDSLNPTWKKLP
jgi:O-antigen ligase